MKQKLGNFELLEQIDPGGYTIVYRAREVMGHGVTRPAAVKILQGWKADDPEQIAALRREVSVLADLSNCPNIVTIYAFDIDPEVGPWIAMELGGKSARHVITDEPGNPVMIRQLLRDILRAFIAIHGAKPPVLHRDLKPNNILLTEIGTWKLADFGLAKRSDSESTLNVLTVQYAAPELLDGSLGKEGPWTDLYSLGLVAYEMALGRTLYKAQFPSVFDPFAGPDATRVDERPKWMYWHTTAHMTLKPLAELLPDFPKDMSDLIAAMIAKPVTERVQSSQAALSQLRETNDLPAGRGFAGVRRDQPREKESSSLLMAIVAVAVLALVVLLGGWLYLQIGSRPVVSLAHKEGKIVTESGSAVVKGRIRNMPNRAVAAIVTRDGVSFRIAPDMQGNFTTEVRLDKLGQLPATLRLTDGPTRLVEMPISFERNPPKLVRISLTTNPPTPDAEVQFTSGRPDAAPIITKTNEKGVVEEPIPYGRFVARITHPRYLPAERQTDTGFEATKSLTVNLQPLPDSALREARRSILLAAEKAAERASQGDADSVPALERASRDLALLEGATDDPEAKRRLSLVGEMIDVARRSLERDSRAQARLDTLRAEVQDLARSSLADQGSERRQAVMRDLADAVERVIKGDRSAVDQISQIRSQISELDAQEGAGFGEASQRTRLLNEIYGISARAASGEAMAIASIREAYRTFQAMPVPVETGSASNRRRNLMEQLSTHIRKASGGDSAAVDGMRRVREGIVELDKTERVASALAARRAKLLGEAISLAESASKGSTVSGVRLRELEQELFALDATGVAALASAVRDLGSLERRAVLVREMADVARAIARDPGSADRLKTIRVELQAIEVAESSLSTSGAAAQRRMDLLTELASIGEMASGGDRAAYDRLQLIQRELAILVAVEQAAGDADRFSEIAAAMLGSAPSLSLLDRGTLLQLPDDQFIAFIRAVVPTGAIDIDTVLNVRRIRLQGVVLNAQELSLLNARLEPATPRLMLEVRADPWALTRRLTERMQMHGFTAVRVHPYLKPGETTLYVQYQSGGEELYERARTIALDFVVDQSIVVVQPVQAVTAPSPAPQSPAGDPSASSAGNAR